MVSNDDNERGDRGRFTRKGGRVNGMKGGRPTGYTEEIAEEICRRIMHGETLNTICADEHMPNRVTVWRWQEQDLHGFGNRYARARLVQATTLTDEALDMLRSCPENIAAAAKFRELAKHIQWL